jgi:ring-1,2-phenylacetyl-CoA epoxidase subunit PaaC
LVFFRNPEDYRNVQMVELPNADWAYTMTRQFLFDAYELVNLANLQQSHSKPLADVAGKIRNEELYHFRHTSSWMRRLGLGTVESNRRTQLALEALWPFTSQLFSYSPEIDVLLGAGQISSRERLKQEWEAIVLPYLHDAGLQIPEVEPIEALRNEHTEHLSDLLMEMQEIAREDPTAQW